MVKHDLLARGIASNVEGALSEVGNTVANIEDELVNINTELANIVTYNAKEYSSLQEMFTTIASGGYVKIPIGTYTENYIVLDGLENLIIEGNGFLSKIKFANLISPLSALDYFSIHPSDFVHFVVKNCKNITFKNIAIEGLYNSEITGSYSHGIIVCGTSDEIKFENISLSKICGEGILNNSTGKVTVINNIFNTIRNSAITSANTGVVYGRRNTIKSSGIQTNVGAISVNSYWDFQDNEIFTTSTGVKLGHATMPATGKIKNNKFTYNGVATTQNCFALGEAFDLDISDNIITGYGYGINASEWVTGDGLKFNNNILKNIIEIAVSSFANKKSLEFKNNKIDGAKTGFRLIDGTINTLIESNDIKNITEKGIWLDITSTGAINQNRLIGNRIDGGRYGICIEGGNELNLIESDNICINQSIKDVYVELSNDFYLNMGNVNNFRYATTPALDGVADGTNQTPSMNNGNNYITPVATAGLNYIIARFDNGYNGQQVTIIATDAYTQFKTGTNLKISANIQTVTGKSYVWKCLNVGGTLNWYLISTN